MYGVVIWSDEDEQKAVIWCEDHGDLAFYRQADGDGRLTLDAGDWVQFDLTMEQHMRYALNPRLVAEGVYQDLAGSLSAKGRSNPVAKRKDPESAVLEGRRSAQVIPFGAIAEKGKADAQNSRAHSA